MENNDYDIYILGKFVNWTNNVKKTIGVTSKNIVFAALLMMLYIQNNIVIDDKQKTINRLKKEITVLKDRSILKQTELRNMCMPSEVLKRIREANLNLEEMTEPPRIIE